MRKILAIAVVAVAVAMPLSTSAAVSKTPTFTGSWNSTCWYKVNLTQKGSTVKGTFTWFAGQVKGTVSGLKLTGTWTQPSEHKSGTFVFTLASTGKTWSGHWAYKGKKAKACSAKKY